MTPFNCVKKVFQNFVHLKALDTEYKLNELQYELNLVVRTLSIN
jgi:hypothetical protein